jgi:hypothetical protein
MTKFMTFGKKSKGMRMKIITINIWIEPGNTNRRGRLSTVNLIEPICLVMLPLIIKKY